jgi:L-ascorbate metabolism protein UlaG (beta-lactamase superfamily)
MTRDLRLTFIGGPTALLEIGGKRLLTDPTFSPAGAHPTGGGRQLTKTEDPTLTAEEVGPVDAVLLSHDQHADNLDAGGRKFVEESLLTLTTPSGAARLGGTAQGLPPWATIRLGRLEVSAVPALHGPPGAERVVGEVTGFLLGGPQIPTVYVSGDNASLEVVQQISRRVRKVDVALLFAGAARTQLLDGAALTLTSEDAAGATRMLAARHVVPLHTRGWQHFTEGPDRLRKAFAEAGLTDRLHLLEPGETWTLED